MPLPFKIEKKKMTVSGEVQRVESESDISMLQRAVEKSLQIARKKVFEDTDNDSECKGKESLNWKVKEISGCLNSDKSFDLMWVNIDVEYEVYEFE